MASQCPVRFSLITILGQAHARSAYTDASGLITTEIASIQLKYAELDSLIRFIAVEDDREHLSQLVNVEVDPGIAAQKGQEVKSRLISDSFLTGHQRNGYQAIEQRPDCTRSVISDVEMSRLKSC